MKKIILVLSVLLALSASVSGCVVVPFIDGFSKLGLSKSDRERLLPKRIKEFHDALYWSDAATALTFVKEEAREAQQRISKNQLMDFALLITK